MGRRMRLHRGGPVGADQRLTRLFYDGDCGLCRGTARLVARWDRSDDLRFAPLGGRTFLEWIPPAARVDLPDSLVVLTPEGALLTRSDAVIHLLRRMGGGWRLGAAALACLPRGTRDLLYRCLARMRPTNKACGGPPSVLDGRFEA